MSAELVIAAAAASERGRRPSEPKFDFHRLMQYMEAEDMPAMARMLGISVNVVRNFVARGISWSRADEMAVRCGVLPWEVWPDWSDADPTEWMGPSCPEDHGFEFLVLDLSGCGEVCALCQPAKVEGVAA